MKRLGHKGIMLSEGIKIIEFSSAQLNKRYSESYMRSYRYFISYETFFSVNRIMKQQIAN